MTALEYVALPAGVPGRSDAFETGGGGPRARRPRPPPGSLSAQLSGGEQAARGVAARFRRPPRLLLADEADRQSRRRTGKQVMDLLFELARADGATLILITQ